MRTVFASVLTSTHVTPQSVEPPTQTREHAPAAQDEVELGASAYARHPEGTFDHFKRTSQNFIQARIDGYNARGARRDPGAEVVLESEPVQAAVSPSTAGVVERGVR